jgi:hypothetical protein
MQNSIMEKRLKKLECIVKNRLFYLKRIEKLSCIASKNLMNFEKFAVGNISDHWEGLPSWPKENKIKIHYIEEINKSFRDLDRSMLPKHRDENGKSSFQLSIDFYEILFGVQIIKIRKFLKEGVNTKFRFFDHYIDTTGAEKYTYYRLMPEPFRHVQIKLIYFYRFVMIKLKRRTHFYSHDMIGEHYTKNYNDYSNHKEFILKDRKTMEVDSLEENVLQRPILNNIEIDKFLSQLEDTIRKNYNICHRIMMSGFINDNPLGHIPFHLHTLYKEKDPEEKQELPSIESISIDEANILSKCLENETRNIHKMILT